MCSATRRAHTLQREAPAPQQRPSAVKIIIIIIEFRWRPGPERRLLPKKIFIRKQGKHLITKHLLFWFSCEFPSSPLKPQTPTPFLSSAWHIILNHPACSWVSNPWGSSTYEIKFLMKLPLLFLLIHNPIEPILCCLLSLHGESVSIRMLVPGRQVSRSVKQNSHRKLQSLRNNWLLVHLVLERGRGGLVIIILLILMTDWIFIFESISSFKHSFVF